MYGKYAPEDMRTIQEYDFIQVSHRLYPPIS